jgi:hypothetical protein
MAVRFPKMLAARVPSDVDRGLRALARAQDLTLGQLLRRILSREAATVQPANEAQAPAPPEQG